MEGVSGKRKRHGEHHGSHGAAAGAGGAMVAAAHAGHSRGSRMRLEEDMKHSPGYHEQPAEEHLPPEEEMVADDQDAAELEDDADDVVGDADEDGTGLDADYNDNHLVQPPPRAVLDLYQHNWSESSARDPRFKKGPWTKEEDRLLQDAIDAFCARHGFSKADKLKLVEDLSHSARTRGAWLEVASAFTDRTVRSIYNRGARLLHTGNYKGSWTTGEEDELRRLVHEYGNSWTTIGKKLNRLGSVCRVKWERIRNEKEQRAGKWTAIETQQLVALVRKYHDDRTEPFYRGGIHWAAVAEEMKTRNASQCMSKWYATSTQMMAVVGTLWNESEDRELIRQVLAMPQDNLSEIDWKQLRVRQSAPNCRKRIKALLKRSPTADGRSWREILDSIAQQIDTNIATGNTHPLTLVRMGDGKELEGELHAEADDADDDVEHEDMGAPHDDADADEDTDHDDQHSRRGKRMAHC